MNWIFLVSIILILGLLSIGTIFLFLGVLNMNNGFTGRGIVCLVCFFITYISSVVLRYNGGDKND